MKYTDFVKEVAKYGWEKTRFQGHADIQSTTMYTHLISSNVQEEIYELYSSVRMPGFFRYEEEVVYV